MRFFPTDYEGERQREIFLSLKFLNKIKLKILWAFLKEISAIIFDMKVLEKIILFVKEFWHLICKWERVQYKIM